MNLRIFPVAPRNNSLQEHIILTDKICSSCEKNGFDGILLFAGNDVVIDPWVMASEIMTKYKSIVPIIAINPIYMHPFQVAKMILSLSLLHQRKLVLNMITGTAQSDLLSISQALSHSSRYMRLKEYIQILKNLLRSSRPLNFDGEFYKLSNLKLQPSLDQSLFPDFLVAGHSEEARALCESTECLSMQMLPRQSTEEKDAGPKGVNFGVLARPTRAEAISVANEVFTVNDEDQAVLEYSMENTDSEWKKYLYEQGHSVDDTDYRYWIKPFMGYKADCPYVVGSYAEINNLFSSIQQQGAQCAIVDTIERDGELDHLMMSLRL